MLMNKYERFADNLFNIRQNGSLLLLKYGIENSSFIFRKCSAILHKPS